MSYIGDFPEDHTTVSILFTTHAASGAAVAPSTGFEAADVILYKNGSATQKTTTNGITMTSPFDSVTGLHCLVIDTSVDTGDVGFWTAGAHYTAVLSPDETVDSLAVIKVIATFSLALAPVFARVGAPVGASISADVAAVQADTDNIQTRIPAALVSGRIDANVGAMAAGVLTATAIAADAITAAKIADGAIDAATFAAGAINAAAIAADAITDAKVASDVTIASVTGAVGSVTGAVGSVTGNVGGNVTGSVGSVGAGGITAASFSAGAIDNAAIAADAIGSSELAASAVTEIQTGLATSTALATLQTSVDDVPTNAELATALAAADDAVLAQVALVKAKTDNLPSDPADASDVAAAFTSLQSHGDGAWATATGFSTLTAAGVRGAVGLASANLDTQLDALPTNTELAAGFASADDAVLAQVALVKSKTDNLPSDPADASDIAAAFSTVNGTLATIAGYIDTEIGTIITNLATVDTVVDAIKVSTDKLDDTVEDDGGTYRFTANALEQAPTGGSAPTASAIADEVQTRTIAAVTLVHGLAANTVNAAAVAPDAVTEIQTGLATGAALSTLATNVDNLPTNAELATALGAADDAVLAAIAALTIPTASANAAALLAAAYEGSESVQDFLRLSRAVLYGKATGLKGPTGQFRDAADSKNRIVETINGTTGARTPTALDAT